MRHGNTNRRYGKTPSHRRAMFRNMATSFLQFEKFYTTVEKAKDLKRIVEPLITLAKKDSLAARKKAYSYLMNRSVVKKLFSDISPRFQSRQGGYLRIIRADRRHGDAAEMAFVELVEKADKKPAKTAESKEAKKKEPKAAKPAKEAAAKEAEQGKKAPAKSGKTVKQKAETKSE